MALPPPSLKLDEAQALIIRDSSLMIVAAAECQQSWHEALPAASDMAASSACLIERWNGVLEPCEVKHECDVWRAERGPRAALVGGGRS